MKYNLSLANYLKQSFGSPSKENKTKRKIENHITNVNGFSLQAKSQRLLKVHSKKESFKPLEFKS